MKSLYAVVFFALAVACAKQPEKPMNPFITELNVPVDYAAITADDVSVYAKITVENAVNAIDDIKQNESPNFENVFVAIDNIYSEMYIASNNCFMLYWVSPDSLTRAKGLGGYQLLDSLSTVMYSDKALFDKMKSFEASAAYAELSGHRKILVDDLILAFNLSGVNLNAEDLAKYKSLVKEISELSSEYSNNMNTSNEILTLDEAGAAGLSDNFKATYKNDQMGYEIPVMNATNDPVMKNASNEETRKAYFMLFNNRAADKNLAILQQLVEKRYELGKLMGYQSYAGYNLVTKMAKNPENVWAFINNLVEKSEAKAVTDLEVLDAIKKTELGDANAGPVEGWDVAYYHNQILKTQYQVDHEKIREYLPMDKCLQGVFDIYQELLGFEFRKVENASVWHEEVDMYEVYDSDKLKGRFYLDLYPRPNKESWFYGVQIASGKATPKGYEVPVSML